jgi:hypothetical protein
MKVRELIEFNPAPNSRKTFEILFQTYRWKDETPVGKKLFKYYTLGTRSISVNIAPGTNNMEFTWEAIDHYTEQYNKNAKRAHGSSYEDLEQYLAAYEKYLSDEYDERRRPPVQPTNRVS